MDSIQDTRWKQRFSNFQNAYKQLTEAIVTNGSAPVDIIKEGIIQRFEFTHELAWKVLKDYLKYEGFQNITGSRSATKETFNIGLISDGQLWMEMIESRNQTVHTYQKNILEIEFHKIIEIYFPLFGKFADKMNLLL